MTGWRKIEGDPDPTKAPWDGLPVLISAYSQKGKRFYKVVRFLPDGRWAISVVDGNLHYFDNDRPTHWAPIDPPESDND